MDRGISMRASTTTSGSEASGFAVRTASWADIPRVVDTLAVGLAEDPVVTWMIPNPIRRLAAFRSLLESELRARGMRYGLVFCTDGLHAAAIWTPPGHRPPCEEEQVWLSSWRRRTLGAHFERGATVISLLERNVPSEPHYALAALGVRPEWQRRGMGSALMRRMLARCDRERTGAYTVASTGRASAHYADHGFAVIGELALPDGPLVQQLWRAPR